MPVIANAQKQQVGEQIWLNYFNQMLYAQGVITEKQRNRIFFQISYRRPSSPRRYRETMR